ncbi:MAG: A24 family peptidase [Ramlibacter sp.]
MNNAPVVSLVSALATLAADPRTAGLFLALATAAAIDCRSLRIPNWLTGCGILFALALNTLPFSPSRAGFLSALGGLVAGFAILLPAYAAKVMGAGDVKLMAMAGAFLGWPETLLAVLFTLLAGGAFALAFAAAHRSTQRLFTNAGRAVHLGVLAALAGSRPSAAVDAAVSAGRIPYSLSICAGTLACLAVRHFGF